MNTPYKQRGMGMWGWMGMIVLFGFLALVGMKLVPVYIQSMTVAKVLEQVGEDREFAGASAGVIREAIMKRLSINDVDQVKREHIKIEAVRGGSQITLNYEVRVPLFYNLSAVATFENESLVRD